MRSRFVPLAATLVLAGCGSAPLAASSTGSAPAAQSSPAQAASSAAPGPRHGAPCQPSAGVSASDFFGGYGPGALTGVQFISAAQGWVIGRRVILATDDGGASWTVQRRGDLNLVSVDFISASTGWAVGLDSLLTTADGGRTWTALPEPCGVIRSVHFFSPQDGYAIAGGVDPVSDATAAPSTGGAVVVTTNGGQSWRPVPAPANSQTVCFSGRDNGWLGADGKLYESADGGDSWQLRAGGPTGPGAPTTPGVMYVQCASGSAWALDVGPGAASSQQPHIGYYARPAGAAIPIFSEQYFPRPGVHIRAESAGSYAGPMSAISAGTAAFIDYCPACGNGTAPWLVAAAARGRLSRRGNVAGISQPFAASFLSPSMGWVVGALRTGSAVTFRVVRTDDGGRSWQAQYPAG